MSLRRRQRFAKYERELLRCSDDIRCLQRFVDAQVVAFRKILKKYRKWTGSSALGSRFKEAILAQPKSFTRRDFSPLQTRHDDLLQTLRAAIPADLDGTMPLPPVDELTVSRPPSSAQVSPSETIVAPESQQQSAGIVGYWNEYDHGSEAGDLAHNGGDDDEYAIYVDPNADVGFPGMKTLGALFAAPARKLGSWMSRVGQKEGEGDAMDGGERGPLLPTNASTTPYGSSIERSYFSTPPGGAGPAIAGAETDAEDDCGRPWSSNRRSRSGSYGGGGGAGGYASSEEGGYFPAGYRAYYAATPLPSIADQRVARYRERVLAWGTWACYGVAFVLMGIAAVLIVAGRNRMRLEVDAGVTLGIMTSLGLACAGLSMACSRRDKLPWVGKAAVWATFFVACVVDGVLLVLVMGRGRL